MQAADAQQSALIEQLRKRMGVLPDDVVVAGDQTAALRRFIVARKGDVDKAEEQLRRALEWRVKDYGVLAVLAKPPRKRLELVRAHMPSNPHLAFSKAGFPVSLTALGGADLAAITQELTADDATLDFVVRAEFYRAVVFPEASRLAGRTVDKEVVMLDVGGLSLGLLKVMPLFKVVNTVGSTYFPERTINILVLNAPRVFKQLWAILQKLVDPRTQKKVHILSGGEQQLEVLRTFLHDADIPRELGGTRAAPFLSGSDARATAVVFARLDQWLSELGPPAAASPPPSPAPPAAPTPAPTPSRPAPEKQAGPAPAAPATPQLERSASAKAPPAAAAKPRTHSGSGAPRPAAARPADSPAEHGASGSSTGALASKPSMRDLELAEPAPGELRNWLVLVLLWVATSLTFSLMAWGTVAAPTRHLAR